MHRVHLAAVLAGCALAVAVPTAAFAQDQPANAPLSSSSPDRVIVAQPARPIPPIASPGTIKVPPVWPTDPTPSPTATPTPTPTPTTTPTATPTANPCPPACDTPRGHRHPGKRRSPRVTGSEAPALTVSEDTGTPGGDGGAAAASSGNNDHTPMSGAVIAVLVMFGAAAAAAAAGLVLASRRPGAS
jgi:pullulanase